MSKHYQHLHTKFYTVSLNDNKLLINDDNNSIKFGQHVYTITYNNEREYNNKYYRFYDGLCIRDGLKTSIKKYINICIDDIDECMVAISTYKSI